MLILKEELAQMNALKFYMNIGKNIKHEEKINKQKSMKQQ